jgi:hypothetical protein
MIMDESIKGVNIEDDELTAIREGEDMLQSAVGNTGNIIR